MKAGQRELKYESLVEFFEREIDTRFYQYEVVDNVFYGLVYNIWEDKYGVLVIPYKEDLHVIFSNVEYICYSYSLNPPFYKCPDRFLDKLEPVTNGGKHWVNECRRRNKGMIY
jgi:hypothetical protein